MTEKNGIILFVLIIILLLVDSIFVYLLTANYYEGKFNDRGTTNNVYFCPLDNETVDGTTLSEDEVKSIVESKRSVSANDDK